MTDSISMKELEKNIAELAVSHKPTSNVEIFNLLRNLSSKCILNCRFGDAIEAYRKAVAIRPDCPDVQYELATNAIIKPSDAAESFLTALELCPIHIGSLQNLAIVRFGHLNFDEAERLCLKAIETSTPEKCVVAHTILGKFAQEKGNVRASERHFAETRRWGGDRCAAQVELLWAMMLGNCQKEEKSESVKSDQTALTPLQLHNRKICKLIKAFRDELRWNSTDANVIGQLYNVLQNCCDWSDYDNRMKKLSDLIDDQLRKKLIPPVDRYSAVNMFPISLQQQLAIATHFSKQSIKKSMGPPIEYHLSGGKLRIGYVLTGVIRFPLVNSPSKFNPDRFEVFFYCYFADPKVQQKVVGDWNDHVIDLSTFGDNSRAAANRIASDGIQILVNLDDHHWTTNFRIDNASAILAHRPAPIQAVYRTSLGSTGASYVDYFITDKVASPLQFAHGYSEKLAYMPNGMFVLCNSDRLTILYENLKDKEELRKRFHLPEYQPEPPVVFCVVSDSCQIVPEMFECWCEILRRVPSSVLWFRTPFMEESQSNLKKEARNNRVNPRRLIFIDESLSSSKDLLRTDDLIDVLLDTPTRSGGLTIGPIFRGIPIVTLPMESFPSRLTASLLTSLGCEELIAKSRRNYIDMAVNLGNKTDLPQKMQVQMWENIRDSKLFRADQYFNDLENLYQKMWKRMEMGEKPDHIV